MDMTMGEFRWRPVIVGFLVAALGVIMWVFLARWGMPELFDQLLGALTL